MASIAIVSVLFAGVSALSIAAAMTWVDWRLNPAGLFHSVNGTNWPVVWETWLSWFVPVFVAILPLLALAVALMRRRG